MKVIIAGSRTITDSAALEAAISEAGFEIAEVVSGGASGVDLMGEQWARAHSVPVKRFNANWRIYGHAAGPIRNKQMAQYANALVAVWDGKSRGTANMIQQAKLCNLNVYVYKVTGE